MRCYNGCSDSQLKAYLDEQTKLRQQIIALGYTVTWFPSGEFYQAFQNYRPVGGEYKTFAGVLTELKRS